jgi:histidine phosphotransferase ChpT
MGNNHRSLADLVGSRICHDLISPIGAISNGLELLGLTGAAQGPEMDLIADSAGNAGARIRFFRIAYGAAGEQIMGRPEVVSVLDAIGRDSRVAVTWGPVDPVSRADVRLVFLALQCFETAMPQGGTVEVARDPDGWTLTGKADALNVDQPLWAGLSGDQDHGAITPALVQFALLPKIASDNGRKISMDRNQGALTLRF